MGEHPVLGGRVATEDGSVDVTGGEAKATREAVQMVVAATQVVIQEIMKEHRQEIAALWAAHAKELSDLRLEAERVRNVDQLAYKIVSKLTYNAINRCYSISDLVLAEMGLEHNPNQLSVQDILRKLAKEDER